MGQRAKAQHALDLANAAQTAGDQDAYNSAMAAYNYHANKGPSTWDSIRGPLESIAPLALSFLVPGLGTALGSALSSGLGLGLGATGEAALGSGLVGAGFGGLTGGAKGALIGGVSGGAGGYLGAGGFSQSFPETSNYLNSVTDGLIGSSNGTPATFGSMFGLGNGDSTSMAPSVTGGTANSMPLTGGGNSGAVPSNNLSSPTLSGSGGGTSSYSTGAGSAGATDISAADPSLTNKLPWQQSGSITPGTQSFVNSLSSPPTDALSPSVISASNAATPGGFDSSLNQPSFTQNLLGSTSPIAQSDGASTSSLTGGSKMGLGLNTLGTLLSGASSLYSNNQAKNALVSGQNKALAQLQPYLASGGAANSELSDLLGTSSNTGATGYGTLGKAFTPDDLTKTPGYNFALDQGNQELDRQNAARGGYFSGGAIKAGQDFAQNLASTTYQQQLQDYLTQQQQKYGMLAGQAGVGANAAGAAGTIFGNTGAAKANALVANNGAFGSTLGSLLGSGKTPINIGGQIVYV